MHGGTESNSGRAMYYVENGRLVFTARYLLGRGKCCGSGCRHCPYPSVDPSREVRAQVVESATSPSDGTRTAWRSY